jgi:hypothetical protein
VSSKPAAISTLPSASSVALWEARTASIEPAFVHVLVVGSYSSALER